MYANKTTLFLNVSVYICEMCVIYSYKYVVIICKSFLKESWASRVTIGPTHPSVECLHENFLWVCRFNEKGETRSVVDWSKDDTDYYRHKYCNYNPKLLSFIFFFFFHKTFQIILSD